MTAFETVHHELNRAILNAPTEDERSIWIRLRRELLTGFGVDLNAAEPAAEEASDAA